MRFITYRHILIGLHEGLAYTIFSVAVVSNTLIDLCEYIDNLLEDSVDGLWLDDDVGEARKLLMFEVTGETCTTCILDE